jgi:hypothetical protein
MIFLQREGRRGVRDSGGSGAVDSVGEESGGGESGGGESGCGESGGGESGAGEPGGGESGAGESGAGESGAGESGAGESGGGESGAGESGAGESGAGESGAGERFSFSCPSCPFQSSTRDRLRDHVLTHLLGTYATYIPGIFHYFARAKICTTQDLQERLEDSFTKILGISAQIFLFS